MWIDLAQCCVLIFVFLIIRRPPRPTRTDTLFPYTTLFRSGFVCNVEPIADSVAEARRRAERDGSGPVILVDHGDNCGSGGNQDVMAVLEEVIRQDLDDVAAGPFTDPESVAKMIAAGVGAKITLQLGGKVDMPAMKLKGRPVEVTGNRSEEHTSELQSLMRT